MERKAHKKMVVPKKDDKKNVTLQKRRKIQRTRIFRQER